MSKAFGLLQRSHDAWDIYSFLLPLGLTVKFGSENFYLADAMVLLLLPVIVGPLRPASARAAPARAAMPPQVKTLLLFGTAWLTAQIVSDLVHSTSLLDMLRGESRIALLLFSLAVFSRLATGRRRLLLFISGRVAAQFVNFALARTPLAQGEPWKFGVGIPVTLLVVSAAAILWSRGHRRTTLLLLIALAVLHLMLGFRSQAAITGIAAVFLTFVPTPGRTSGASASSGLRMFAVVVLIPLTVSAGVALYVNLAATGRLGPGAQAKYLTEANSGENLLFASRFETGPSIAAIADAPLLGHGSNARDARFVLLLPQPARTAAILKGDDRIPTHSQLLEAWVDGGVVGAAFWVYVLLLCTRALLRTIRGAIAVAPLVVYITWNLIWNIGFSPFAADRHFTEGFVLAVIAATVGCQTRVMEPAMDVRPPRDGVRIM